MADNASVRTLEFAESVVLMRGVYLDVYRIHTVTKAKMNPDGSNLETALNGCEIIVDAKSHAGHRIYGYHKKNKGMFVEINVFDSQSVRFEIATFDNTSLRSCNLNSDSIGQYGSPYTQYVSSFKKLIELLDDFRVWNLELHKQKVKPLQDTALARAKAWFDIFFN